MKVGIGLAVSTTEIAMGLVIRVVMLVPHRLEHGPVKLRLTLRPTPGERCGQVKKITNGLVSI